MGKKPADIEQEIKARRRSISSKVEELTQRGADDVEEAVDRFSSFISSSPLGKVSRQAEEQPLLTVGGALALGVILGMASDQIGRGERSIGQGTRSGDGSGVGAGLLGGLIGALESAIVDEGKQLIHEFMAPAEDYRHNGYTRQPVP